MTSRSDRRRTHGRYSDPLAAAKKSARPREGQHGQVVAPEPSAIRAAIEAGTCPWCARGPYKVLAAHTNVSHGVSAAELRELAGLGKRASICDPNHSQDCRSILVERSDWLEMSRRGNAVGVAKGVHKAANEGRKRQVRNDMAQTDALVARRYGEGALLRDIVAETGLGIDGVRGALARLGLPETDNRTRRAHNPLEREVMASSLAKAREGVELAAQRRGEQLLKEFGELGGTVDAVGELAARHGVKPKNMRSRLVKLGAIPAGRTRREA